MFTGLALLLGVALPRAASADGQSTDSSANHAVYLELLGSGGLASLNYEYLFGETWAVRAGLGLLAVAGATDQPTLSAYGAPLALSYVGTGSGSHRFELGIGFMPTLVVGSVSRSALLLDVPSLLGLGILGYRYHPADGGFLFRAAFTPFFGGDRAFRPWPGISIGTAF